jgi:hypothetical protein
MEARDGAAGALFESVLERLQGVYRRDASNAQGLCPAHPDSKPSLSIRATNSKILLFCHRGCPPEKITAALGIAMKDLFIANGDAARSIQPSKSSPRTTIVMRPACSSTKWSDTSPKDLVSGGRMVTTDGLPT